MKRILAVICLGVASAASWAQSSATQQADAAASNAGVSTGVQSQSSAQTWVFPAPVAPGMVVAAKCTNAGVKSAALLFNLVSWSVPDREVSLGCQAAADIDMLVRLCQFGAAARVQAHYLRAAYGIEVAPHPGAVDLGPDECFKPKAAPAPVPIEALPPTSAGPAPVAQPVVEVHPLPPAPAPAPPAPPAAAQRQPFEVTVLFPFDKATLDANARTALDVAARYVQATPAAKLVLTIGHADRKGGAAYNVDLSRRRAESVSAFLLAAGVRPEMMRIEYRGSTEPVSPQDERNRRATVHVIE